MKRPFDAYFGGADRAAWTRELQVRPNDNVEVQLRIEPKINFIQHEITFGLVGDSGDRPEPISTENTFIKVGLNRSQRPETEPTHYIDESDGYHIQSTKVRTVGNTYTLGFVIKTHGPGRYPVRLYVMSDAGESRPRKPLCLIVSE